MQRPLKVSGQSNIPFQVKLCLKLFNELPRASARGEDLSGKRGCVALSPVERFEGAYLERKEKKKITSPLDLCFQSEIM